MKNIIRIFTQNNILEFLKTGHPYHTSDPAILFLKRGNISIKKQINEINLSDNTLILLDVDTAYEVLKFDRHMELFLMVYSRDYIENLTLKFNRLSVYRNIRSVLREDFQIAEQEMLAFFENIKHLRFFLENYESGQTYYSEIIESCMSSVLYQLAGVVQHENEKNPNKMMTRAQEISLQFLKMVSQHFKESTSVNFYAEQLHLTSRHLSSVLKDTLGKTAHQIISDFVSNEAKALLSSTQKTLSEIAYDLNFSDQYAFSHFFKKHFNLSPNQYRRQFKD
ncbi:MAG: hypothetical protein BGO40_11640 [Chryseobacterium sp. 39-10]|nr:helix-turn-helix transcriptional regulator [Chryseobacterium sp.]OJV47489.1 MAG: hypothetical protein BGO40_11640 [Chryseobacterium sp. 39-10]